MSGNQGPTGTRTNQPVVDPETLCRNASPVCQPKGKVVEASDTLKIGGVVVAGGPLTKATIVAVNEAAAKTPTQWRRYIAYQEVVRVGGSLAWRANNPGNLRDAPTKVGSVPGLVGHFAVFASLEDGRAAQRSLYLDKYGEMTVKDAVTGTDAVRGLTPPSENDTTKYLADLKKAGIDLDKDVKSQIDLLMRAIQVNEGLTPGIEVPRVP